MVEHLWAVIGKSPIPVAIAIECLQPERVTPILTELAAVEQLRRTVERVRWSEPVVIDGFDPVAAATRLRDADLQPGDLLWGPGTTPMNIEVVNRWTLDQATKWGENDHRRWYLPARGGVLLPDIGVGVNVAEALRDARTEGIDVLCTLEGLCKLSRLPNGSVPRWSRQVSAGDPSPFIADDLAPLVLKMLGLEQVTAREVEAVGAGRKRGDLLEAVAFHLVVEIIRSEADAGRVIAPTTVSLNVKAAPPNDDTVVELDVVVQSGPLLTNISCGAIGQDSFRTKFMEAKDRAQQIGGSEARASLFCHRTSRTAKKKEVPDRESALEQAASDRTRLAVGQRYGTLGGRFGLCRLDEMFAGRKLKPIKDVLADPVSKESEVPGLEQFVAFVRNAVYR